MSINVPDSIPKLLVFVGLITIGSSFYISKEFKQKRSDVYDKYDIVNDSVILFDYIINLEREDLIKKSENLSLKYNVENPITHNDSLTTFNQTLNGEKNDLLVSDSINKYWKDYLDKKKKLNILIKNRELQSSNFDNEKDYLESKINEYNFFLFLGLFLFLAGFYLWTYDEPAHSFKDNIKQENKIYNWCQSCGNVFNSMLKYGTNKNKETNYAFCEKCYKKGKFTEPNLTYEEFIERKKERNKDYKWYEKKVLLNRYKALERWRYKP